MQLHHTQIVPDSSPALQPLRDTWQWKQDYAKWTTETGRVLLSMPTAEHNAWFSDAIEDIFTGCCGLLRPRLAWVINGSPSACRLDWQPGTPVRPFIDQLIQATRSSGTKIEEISVEVDVRAWFRLTQSAGDPVLGWLDENQNDLTVAGGSSDEGIYISLRISNTVFAPRSPEYDDNSELYRLNQPRLECALRALHSRFGGYVRAEGESCWIYDYGFLAGNDSEEKGK